MEITHDTLVVFAKTFGLFYLIAMSLVAGRGALCLLALQQKAL